MFGCFHVYRRWLARELCKLLHNARDVLPSLLPEVDRATSHTLELFSLYHTLTTPSGSVFSLFPEAGVASGLLSSMPFAFSTSSVYSAYEMQIVHASQPQSMVIPSAIFAALLRLSKLPLELVLDVFEECA